MLLQTLHAGLRAFESLLAEMQHWSRMLAQQHLGLAGYEVMLEEMAHLRAVWRTLVSPGGDPWRALPGLDPDWRDGPNYYSV